MRHAVARVFILLLAATSQAEVERVVLSRSESQLQSSVLGTGRSTSELTRGVTPITLVLTQAALRVAAVQVHVVPDHRDWTYDLGQRTLGLKE